MKNQCFCKIENNIIYRNPVCWARFHTGTSFEYSTEDLKEMNNRFIKYRGGHKEWLVEGIKETIRT